MTLLFVTLTLSYLVATFVAVEIIQEQVTNTLATYSVQATKSTLSNIYHRIDTKTNELISITNDPEIVDSIKKSNIEFENMHDVESYISEIDLEWIAGKETKVISDILANHLSDNLKGYQDNFRTHDNKRSFAEIFITNKQGVVIGSTDRTSDYLQSDEDWYTNTLAENGSAWLGQPEYDESSKTFSIDIVAPIKDENGDYVGMIKEF